MNISCDVTMEEIPSASSPAHHRFTTFVLCDDSISLLSLSLSLSLSLCPYLLLYFLSVCCYMPIYLSLSVSGTMNLPISISLSPYLALCLIAFTHFFPFSCNIFLSIRFLGFRYILCPPSLLLSVSIFEWTNLQFLLIHLCLRNMKGNRHR